MAAKPLPDAGALRQLLEYEPETGLLRWKERGPEWFAGTPARSPEREMKRWNAAYAGKEALACIEPRGYRAGAVLRQAVKAHRVIWKMVHGTEPENIDHINGRRADNRLCNLRAATAAENTRNAKRRADNTTGIAGIERHKRCTAPACWRVSIGGEYIGLFACIGQAIKARREAERRHGFHENHGRAA